MTVTEIKNSIEAGTPFTFKSFRKKGRVLSITAIIRPKDGNLFIIKANDLKRSSGLYNEHTILPIIDNAINNRQQSSFRIR